MEKDGNLDIRILIVDDMPAMRNLVVSMLRNLGYRNVVVAEDGLLAWNIVESEAIDLIISDWNMPNMTGIELLHKVRTDSRYEDIPFIMLTGIIDENNVALAAETNVDTYIMKPFNIKDLENRINLILKNKNQPSDYQKLLIGGMKKQKDGDFKGAMQYYKAAISIRPNKATGYYRLGKLHEEMGDYQQAKSAYEKALSIKSQYIKALDGLSKIYSLEGDDNKLYEVLSILINMSPNNMSRQLQLGRLALENGDKNKGKACLIKVIKFNPDNEEMLFEVGKLFFDHEMIDDAEPIFNKLISNHPKNSAYLEYGGDILMIRKQYDKARSIYWALLRILETPATHFKLAQLYIESGSRRMAEQHLESALMLDRKFEEARNILNNLDQLILKAKEAKSAP
jgi:two-component system, chemotaxis family, chemotaxis protein CheY